MALPPASTQAAVALPGSGWPRSYSPPLRPAMSRFTNTLAVPILNRPFTPSKFDKKFREQMVQSHKRVVAET